MSELQDELITFAKHLHLLTGAYVALNCARCESTSEQLSYSISFQAGGSLHLLLHTSATSYPTAIKLHVGEACATFLVPDEEDLRKRLAEITEQPGFVSLLGIERSAEQVLH